MGAQLLIGLAFVVGVICTVRIIYRLIARKKQVFSDVLWAIGGLAVSIPFFCYAYRDFHILGLGDSAELLLMTLIIIACPALCMGLLYGMGTLMQIPDDTPVVNDLGARSCLCSVIGGTVGLFLAFWLVAWLWGW